VVVGGFDSGLGTVWVAEGVFFYMTAEGVGGVLREAARLTGGEGRFVADVSGTGVLGLAVMRPYLEFLRGQGLAGPFCTDDPGGMMEGAGWGVERVTWAGRGDANYGRFAVVSEEGGVKEEDVTMRTHLAVGRRP
jgi:O-methyltransferase involved in polyketide biosynthesis